MSEYNFDLESIVRPNIWSLKPYRCARDDYSEGILLDANENAFGAVISGPHVPADLHRYPDPHQVEFKTLYANMRRGSSPRNVFMGVGSDEAIDILFRVFCNPGTDCVVVCPPTYGMYSVSAQINQVEVLKVPLIEDNFQLNVTALLETVDTRTVKLMFFCSPGNPTGTALSRKAILQVLDSSYKGIVVVDEAYIDFVPDLLDTNLDKPGSMAPWIEKYPNLVVLQTMSKAFGMAGIRCGVALGHPDIIQLMNNVKPPYNISRCTALACEALRPAALTLLEQNIKNILTERDFLVDKFQVMDSVDSIIGGRDANFLLVRLSHKVAASSSLRSVNKFAESLYVRMASAIDDNVVVRFRGNEMFCEGCLRVTVGTRAENIILVRRWEEVVQELVSEK